MEKDPKYMNEMTREFATSICFSKLIEGLPKDYFYTYRDILYAFSVFNHSLKYTKIKDFEKLSIFSFLDRGMTLAKRSGIWHIDPRELFIDAGFVDVACIDDAGVGSKSFEEIFSLYFDENRCYTTKQ